MKIGILSDTHNNIEMTRKAVERFKQEGVDMVVHAGDITSSKMLQLFAGLTCRFVLGNGDIDVEALNEESARLGFGAIEGTCEFIADGKTIIVFHGNDVPQFRRAVASGKYDYLIKGHTHLFENYVTGTTRIINPGALYGTDEFSVAILDTDTGKVMRFAIHPD